MPKRTFALRGGTVTIRGWDPPMFDPMLSTAYRVQIPLSFTHSRLVRHKVGPSVVPGTFPIEGDLAESWTQPNETTYVFKLRRGVRWHPKPPVNGRELTSADVKYTIERFLTVKGNPSAYMLRAIDRVETPDPLTVRMVLKEPNAWFVEMLANPGRRVQCRAQPVTGIKRSGAPLLKVEDRLQPQLAEQDITRGKSMIKRPRRCLEPLGDRTDRHGNACHDRLYGVDRRVRPRRRRYVGDLDPEQRRRGLEDRGHLQRQIR